VDTLDDLLEKLRGVLGTDGLLTGRAAGRIYARDASHMRLGAPLAVALPQNADEVAQVLCLCAGAAVPVVCRGTGTGLSGGALPPDGALVLSMARLDELGPVDSHSRTVFAGAGVLNARVTTHGHGAGLAFAPDPSSQHASTIGGNIAENAGGPHCLRHGVTRGHLRRLWWCDAAGESWVSGRGLACERGLDLVSLLCGSEGTLGVVTGADLALVPSGAAVQTLFAVFPDLGDAVQAVVGMAGSGLLPVAMEIVDRTMLLAVEEAFAFGFPTDVEAAMIVEFSGGAEEVAADAATAEKILLAGGASEVVLAADEDERRDLWRCRKKAFGAVGRLAPNYVTMDVVVPVGNLPRLVRDIQSIKEQYAVGLATAFHAGDGNLHPGVHFDDRDPEQTRRAHAAADAIIQRALDLDGSVTGEHGVGIEKLPVVSRMLDGVTAQLQEGIKGAFDPRGLLNPGKKLPARGTDYPEPKPAPSGLRVDWESLTVTTPANRPLAEVQAALMERALWIPVGAWLPRKEGNPGLARAGRIGEMVEQLLPCPGLGAWGTARDMILELRAETGDGRPFHAGAPVLKNVAGYSLPQALCGSGEVFVRTVAATFQVRPIPPAVGVWVCRPGAIPVGPSALGHLLDAVRSYRGAFPGAVVWYETDGENLRGDCVVMVPGRDTAWDLAVLNGRIRAAIAEAGCDCAHHEVTGFRESVERLEELGLQPDWAVSSATWTTLTALPGDRGHVIPGTSRGILYQLNPQVWWVPEAAASDSPWYADVVWENGRATPPAPPAAGVPLPLLEGIKRAFDPHGNLMTPQWLRS